MSVLLRVRRLMEASGYQRAAFIRMDKVLLHRFLVGTLFVVRLARRL